MVNIYTLYEAARKVLEEDVKPKDEKLAQFKSNKNMYVVRRGKGSNAKVYITNPNGKDVVALGGSADDERVRRVFGKGGSLEAKVKQAGGVEWLGNFKDMNS